MIQSAGSPSISTVFDTEARVKYIIPKFQREYIWKKEHWEHLFNDLTENDKGYFFGSIICVDRGKDIFGIRPVEIIDGQQRLSTVSLLYAAIYKKLLEEQRQDDEFITQKTNLKHRLIQKGRKNELKIELSTQKNNLDDYKAILAELNLCDANRPQYLGNRIIYKAYRYFQNQISDFDYAKLIELLDKINAAILVKIEVKDNTDAYMLFESLNDRGEPLSAIDLIKNNILSELERNNIQSIDEAYNNWQKIIDSLPNYSDQERFLRQYYNAFKYKEKILIKDIPRATRSNLIKIYDKLIEQDVKFIFDEIIQKSNVYTNFIKPQNNYYRELIDLLHIGAAPSYTFLLYLFSEHPDSGVLIMEAINFLVKYFVRRHLTDFPPTRELDGIFMGLIKKCEENRESLTSQTIIAYLTDKSRFKDFKDFKENLSGNIYENNTEATRFILCKIEETNQTRETLTDLWKRDEKDRYIWTIEHIFPEGENIPQEWVNMIANGNIKEAKKLQEEYVHKLGNLTLSGYNSNLSNFSFEKKRDREDRNGRYIGYRNGMYLNQDLANKQRWVISDIQQRTAKLIEEAYKLFKVNGEE